MYCEDWHFFGNGEVGCLAASDVKIFPAKITKAMEQTKAIFWGGAQPTSMCSCVSPLSVSVVPCSSSELNSHGQSADGGQTHEYAQGSF